MKFKSIVIAVILLCIIHNAWSQSNSEVLSNKSVIEMYKAGLSRETVISKIKGSVCKFDVTTTGLIALKKQGVADDIITAMVNKGNSKVSSTVANSSNNEQAGEKKLNIELLNYVYTFRNDTIIALEKALANLKTKAKAFGYGGVNSILEIDGGTSSIKISSSNSSSFIIKTGNETTPDIVLYKLKVSNKKRQAVTGKFTMGGMQGSEGAITVNFSKFANGILKITPSKPLDKGEYFFLNRSMSNAGTNSEVFAFSVN